MNQLAEIQKAHEAHLQTGDYTRFGIDVQDILIGGAAPEQLLPWLRWLLGQPTFWYGLCSTLAGILYGIALSEWVI